MLKRLQQQIQHSHLVIRISTLIFYVMDHHNKRKEDGEAYIIRSTLTILADITKASLLRVQLWFTNLLSLFLRVVSTILFSISSKIILDDTKQDINNYAQISAALCTSKTLLARKCRRKDCVTATSGARLACWRSVLTLENTVVLRGLRSLTAIPQYCIRTVSFIYHHVHHHHHQQSLRLARPSVTASQ